MRYRRRVRYQHQKRRAERHRPPAAGKQNRAYFRHRRQIDVYKRQPYIYQGEETGMTPLGFSSLDQYRDVESINHFHILRGCGLHEDLSLIHI